MQKMGGCSGRGGSNPLAPPSNLLFFAPAVSVCIVDGRADSRPFRRTAFVLLEQTVLPLSLGPRYFNKLQPPVGGLRF
jgi:hypothetical protein